MQIRAVQRFHSRSLDRFIQPDEVVSFDEKVCAMLVNEGLAMYETEQDAVQPTETAPKQRRSKRTTKNE